MKKIELIVGSFAFLGILFRILEIWAWQPISAFAFATLTVFYLVFSFAYFSNIKLKGILKKVSYKEVKAQRIVESVVLGWGISIIVFGIYNKLMYITEDKILLLGLVCTGIILFILTIFFVRSRADYYKRFFKKIAIYGGLGLVLYLTPPMVLVEIYFRNYPDYIELVKRAKAEPDNSEVGEEIRQMVDEITRHKK
jgi:hypothetical protein